MQKWLQLWCVAVAPLALAQENWQPAKLQAHETEWIQRDKGGEVVSRFVEIQSGLNRKSEDGSWVRSSDEIELFQGGAIVRGTQFKAIFSASSDDPNGVFDIDLPDTVGRLRGQCVGLAYTSSNGDSVFIAEIKDVQGTLVGRNEIIYENCFTGGIKADLRYRVTVGSVVQDVILRSKIDSPQAYGLPDGKLEVWTEFMNAPQAQKHVWQAQTRGGKAASDCVLDFGPMKIGAGRAALLGKEGRIVLGNEVAVHKEYEQIDGHTFLIESVPVEDIANELGTLPEREQAALDLKKLKEKLQARRGNETRQKPVSLAIAHTEPQSERPRSLRQVAFAERPETPGYVVDFDLGSSYTDYIFRSDTTYYCSGIVDLYGTNNVFQGGAVIKFAPTNAAQIIINSGASATFDSAPYKPVIFCARDDQSAGVSLNTNTISGYYADPALVLFIGGSVETNTFKELRISDCNRGLYVQGHSGSKYNLLTHAQFVRCNQGLTCNSALIDVRNVLFDGSTSTSTNGAITNFLAVSSTIHGEHLTINGSTKLFHNYGSTTLTLTNSLLIAVTNFGNTFTSASNYTNSSSSGIFAEVGAGKHYLASGSALRNAGTTNINAALAADLQNRTTYPPILLTNVVSSSTTLSPQASPDTDTPDLGFHYSPMDYILNEVVVTNAVLSITNGVTMGTYFNYSLYLTDGAQLFCNGRPDNLNRFADYARVQEQPTFFGGASAITIAPYKYTNLHSGSVNLRFTEFLGWSRYHIYEEGDFQTDSLSVRDCEFINGSVWLKTTSNGSATADFMNNLFERAAFTVLGNNPWTFYNNLYYEGSVSVNNGMANSLTFKDNAFDNPSFATQTNNVVTANNGYINTAGRVNPTGGTDVIVGSFNYATGPLGKYYQSSSDFADAGSRNATNAGLYHFTAESSLTKEANSVVDIGYHYVATDGNGVPTDTDSDGTPDWLEDINGDGAVNSGETDWQDADDLGFRVYITQPKSNSNIP